MFELLRHFLHAMFYPDFGATPDRLVPLLCGVGPVFLQWFFLLIGPLRHKYEDLSRLPGPLLYREAVRADEFWLITLMMAAVGLVAALKWQMLFPDMRDYQTLGTLPVRPWRIFMAKFATLVLTAAATLVTINILPCVAFPALSGGRWAFQLSFSARLIAHAEASLSASAFAFFAVVAFQGVLLNTLRPRVFSRIAGHVQGGWVAFFVATLLLSFSVGPSVTKVATERPLALFLPPVWFLGLHQALLGDLDPAMRGFAAWSGQSLLLAVAVSALTYLLSYRRHQTILMEVPGDHEIHSGWLDQLLRLDGLPRRAAILQFLSLTIARNRHHRMILMGYSGAALALLVMGAGSMRNVVPPGSVLLGDFVYCHMLVLLLWLAAARHVFALPAELKANWLFQITEPGAEPEWMSAVDRFAAFGGFVFLLVLGPIEVWVLGWKGAGDIILFTAVGLLAYEFAFSSWDRLPFTCSYTPGKIPVWMMLLFFGFIGVLALIHALVLAVLSYPALFGVVLAALIVIWYQKHTRRQASWGGLHLRYDDPPEPVIRTIGLIT